MTGALFTKVQGSNFNLVLEAGGEVSFSIEYASDTTSYSSEMCIKSNVNGDEIITLTVGGGEVILGGANKLITYKLTKAQRADLPSIEGIYAINTTTDAGVALPQIYGKCKIEQAYC